MPQFRQLRFSSTADGVIPNVATITKELDVSPWYRLTAPATVLVSLGVPASLPAQAHHPAHWTYEGEAGPAHWGSLDPAFARCAMGHAQSPIDISAPKSQSLPKLSLHYQETQISVVNNGHTIQVAYDPGSSLEIEGTRYQLIQFHFHTPSEHTFEGKHAPEIGRAHV